jgi:hypothetical protein
MHESMNIKVTEHLLYLFFAGILKTSKDINIIARFNCRCPHFRNINLLAPKFYI